MKKLIAAFNMTLDGYCDHTAIDPNEEIHQHYADLLSKSDAVLYGRTTYELMEYWRQVLENPTGIKAIDEFASTMNQVPKIVFSKTLKHIEWESASLAKQDLQELVAELKQKDDNTNKDIYVGSPSLIVALTNLNLIDEYQLCIHPVLLGKGLTLFKNLNDAIHLKLIKTKPFESGAVILYYEPS